MMLTTINTNGAAGQGMNSLSKNRSSPSLRHMLLWVLGLTLVCIGMPAYAQQVVGQVTHLSGVLTARHADGTRKVLGLKSAILQGDTLVTERETYTRVKFVDNAEIVLRPGSEVSVDKYVYDEKKPENDSVAIGLVKGGLRAVTGLVGKRNHEAVNFNTPTATIGIRGTNFGAIFCQADCGGIPTPSGTTPAPGLYVDVSSGAVLLSNQGGQQLFTAGQFGYVPSMTQVPVIVPPASGLQFTMPPTISRNTGNGSNGVGVDKNAVNCIVQ